MIVLNSSLKNVNVVVNVKSNEVYNLGSHLYPGFLPPAFSVIQRRFQSKCFSSRNHNDDHWTIQQQMISLISDLLK